MENQPINLAMNFERMHSEAQRYENTYGQDKGHGWLMRHPITKLGKFQQYLVETKLRKSTTTESPTEVSPSLSQAVARSLETEYNQELEDTETDDSTEDETESLTSSTSEYTVPVSTKASAKPAAKAAAKRSTPKKSATQTVEPLNLSEEEKDQLRSRQGWIEEIKTWLADVDGCSESNARSVMSKVKMLAKGEGISYVGWPDGIMFMKGESVNLAMDFESMHSRAKAFEDKHGEDKGHGWVMRHPIAKLGKFQRYLVEEKLRKSSTADSTGDSPKTNEASVAASRREPKYAIGTVIYKNFPTWGWFSGNIVDYNAETGYYDVHYPQDNDEEQIAAEDIEAWIKAERERRASASPVKVQSLAYK